MNVKIFSTNHAVRLRIALIQRRKKNQEVETHHWAPDPSKPLLHIIRVTFRIEGVQFGLSSGVGC